MTAAVIPAEPDAYDTSTGVLMGRHSAGQGFLRAVVAAQGDEPIYGRTPAPASALRFKELLTAIDPAVQFFWVQPQDLDTLSRVGVLHLADPNLPKAARMRLRAGINAFSISGLTHTTSSTGAMDMIIDLLREPVAPWDALICTSNSVLRRFGDFMRPKPTTRGGDSGSRGRQSRHCSH